MSSNLKVVRGGHRRTITRIVNKYEDIEEITDIDEITGTIDVLQRKHELLSKLDGEILETTSEEEINDEIDEMDRYDIIIQKTLSKLTRLSKSSLNANAPVFMPVNSAVNSNTYADCSGSLSSSGTNHSLSFHKLPKLTITKFDGNLLFWQSFWDSFEGAIDKNDLLTNAQKFNYLKSHLIGEANQCIAGLQITNANYSTAIQLLKERFGQEHRLINTFMKNLAELPAPTSNTKSLKSFYDKMESYVRGLESLGRYPDSYGSILVPIILGKLPQELRRNITRDNGGDDWNFNSLRKAILKEFTIQDACISSSVSDDFTSTAAFITRTQRAPANNERRNKITSKPCVFCGDIHAPTSCNKVTDINERKRIVKEKGICFNCFAKHRVSDCKSKNTCRKCERKHHTSICYVNERESPDVTENKPNTKTAAMHTATEMSDVLSKTTHIAGATEKQFEMDTAAMHTTSEMSSSQVLLKTAVAPVSNDNGNRYECNILFDEGAQRTFIRQSFANILHYKSLGVEELHITGFGGKKLVRHVEEIRIDVHTHYNHKINVEAVVVPEIAAPIEMRMQEVRKLPYIKNLKLAHCASVNEKFEVQLLIGADYYWSFVQDNVIRGNGPTAVKSKLGYLLSGPVNMKSVQGTSTAMLNIRSHREHVECDLEKFWKLETLGISSEENYESIDTKMKHYQDKNIYFRDDKYHVVLPWKEEHPDLPTNENIARKRTVNVVKRLASEPKMLEMYGNIIMDQESRGFIEKVPLDEIPTEKRVHYIPHHPVKKDSITTPIRIVYDCSCKQDSTSPSLNDCLSSDPPILNDLTGILTRFRAKKYGISTDIEKAFLQINLDENDKDVTRFFWLQDPRNPNSSLITYRFRSVLFGATCSPFILNATLLKHVSENPSETADTVRRDIYVDNVLTSANTEDDARRFFHESRKLLSDAGFNLRSWASNSAVLQETANSQGVIDQDTETKILGMRWDPQQDVLNFVKKIIHTELKSTSKREVLRQSSSIFDPLGFLGPITIRMKLLMQQLWKQKFSWDEILPENIHSEWIDISRDIQSALEETRVPRHLFNGSSSQLHSSTLHVFVDASEKAYGASVYVCNGQSATLVISKNRVSPLKTITLPRLELMAAVIGARLAKNVQQSLDVDSVFYWSDSQVVLHWLSSSKSLNKFVENRKREIMELTAPHLWKYVPTDMNPADLQTRGLSAEQLKTSELWWHGPKWLNNKEQWPVWEPKNNTVLLEIDRNANQIVIPTNYDTSGIHRIVDITRFSTLYKLLRVSAYVLRFISKCKTKRRYNLRTRKSDVSAAEELSSEEIGSALKYWIFGVQNEDYHSEMASLQLAATKEKMRKSSMINQLRLFQDDSKILRCGGRIGNSPLNNETKFPILLPKKHRFTNLVVMDIHIKGLHSGSSQTITQIRQKYWIPQIRQCVNHLLRKCVSCRKVISKPYSKPDPPQLPQDRVTDTVPFDTTGVDFAGPLYVKDYGTQRKMYICLFTCAWTRAIHLELVPNLSTESFILAFRRFVSSKNSPHTMYSDNAATFVSAHAEIVKILNYNMKWKFIPKGAPWYGGWWERLIGMTKITLKKVLGKAHIHEENLRTILCEIEAVINDRPLTYVSSEIQALQPLTPAHLLYGRMKGTPSVPISEEHTNITHSEANKQSERKELVLQHFLKRWRMEYLTGLREFHKFSGNNETKIKVGDIVQVYDDAPRTKWKLAMIDELIVGNDGLVRAAKIHTASNKTTTRPVTKLYPLELR